jgi:two-component system response regulator AlgR
MNILIADDEAPARRRLRDLLDGIAPTAASADEAADGGEALRLAAERLPDVVFLDIRMPRLDGIEVARHLARLPKPPAVVFTTAYDDYALEAFEVSAVDYLLKPIRRERLATALHRAQRLSETAWRRLEAALPAGRPARSQLCAYRHGELRLIPAASVLFFRAEQKYTVVRTVDEEVLIDDSLKSLEDEFGDAFIRIHRNALVAAAAVIALERKADGNVAVRLRGIDEALSVSRRHLTAVKSRLRYGSREPR